MTKVWVPVPDGNYENLIGRYAYIEEDGKQFGMDVPEYDCNTGEWLETPCYVDMQDIRLCRLTDQPDAPSPAAGATPAGAGVPNAEVVRFIRWFLNAHAFHLAFDRAYMETHPEEVAAYNATLAWLSAVGKGGDDAAS